MNSNTRDAEGPPSKQTQSLSRFHPRSVPRADEQQGLPGEDAKNKEGWAHAPSGLRPVRSQAKASNPPVMPIPNIFVPKPASDLPEAAVPADEPSRSAVLPAAPLLPERLLEETSIVLKIGLVALFLFAAVLAFKFGEHRGRKIARQGIKPDPVASALAAPISTPAAVPAPPPAEFPEDQLPALNAALGHLRDGENLEALDSLNKLAASHPQAPSLQYAAAIAALQAGYPREADRLADASIKNGFRVSDSWALKAAIAAAKSKGASPEQEALLKKAIAADPMNPAPFLELASLLRYQGRNEPAAALLESASFRLNPADAQTVIETTRAILAVDVAGKLVPPSEPLGIPSKDLPNAYSEMKRGNFENAAAILRFCRDQTAPDLFGYLVNDPSLRKFTARQELKEFY
ncbi:MAG: hypothetical protein WC003_02885 [Terrimicrobiaceae bacterium]